MAKSKKSKTTDQALKSLFKDVEGTIFSALLCERILVIMEATEKSIDDEPDEWRNFFVSPEIYTKLIDIVKKNIHINE